MRNGLLEERYWDSAKAITHEESGRYVKGQRNSLRAEPTRVAVTIRDHGEILAEKSIWPIVFTQHLIVARRRT
jgi:hypothetical protein